MPGSRWRQLAPRCGQVHVTRMRAPSFPILAPRTLALASALAAAAALGLALASETWGELVPCTLCLLERWPYRIAIVLGLAAAVAPSWLTRPLLALLALTILAGAGIAGVHAGVEFHWWPSPMPECAAKPFAGGSIADILKSMPARPAKPCDDPTFLIPGLPVSMAAMNMLFALIFSGGLFVALTRKPSTP